MPQVIYEITSEPRTIWSTWYLSGDLAGQEVRFFTTPVAQKGQGKSSVLQWMDTNLREAGRLPGGTSCILKNMRIEFFGLDSIENMSVMEMVALAGDDQKGEEPLRKLLSAFLESTVFFAEDYQTRHDIGPLSNFTPHHVSLPCPHIVFVNRDVKVTIPANYSFSFSARFGDRAPWVKDVRMRMSFQMEPPLLLGDT